VPGSFVQFGEVAQPGKRCDLLAFADAMRTGKRGRDLFELHPLEFIKYPGAAAAVTKFYDTGRSEKTVIYWCWGATGTGKSRWAFRTYPGAYWKPPTNKWWDGYDPGIPGHDVVIVDDYRRDFCTIAELLRLFDCYPLQVENKGGSLQARPKIFIITAPYPPALMWRGRTAEALHQLVRRIEHVVYFDGTQEAGNSDAESAVYRAAYDACETRLEEAAQEGNRI
jgi:hypothetical protein